MTPPRSVYGAALEPVPGALSNTKPLDVPALVKRIEIRNPPFPVELTCHRQVTVGGWLVHVTWKVPHRDNPMKLVEIGCYAMIKDHDSEMYALMEIEDRIRGAFVHEFQECFHIDGVRIRDPHAPVTYPAATMSYPATKPEGV